MSGSGALDGTFPIATIMFTKSRWICSAHECFVVYLREGVKNKDACRGGWSWIGKVVKLNAGRLID